MALEKVKILIEARVTDGPKRAFAGVVDTPQSDLLYMDSLLVSTGDNKNDDVFLPDEMWKARHSPRLKPVDWEHETGSEVSDEDFAKNPRQPVAGNQIIGVMYNTYAVDDHNNVIDEVKASAPDFQIPSSFHIIDQAVLYRSLFPKLTAKIEKGAKEGTLFVSMEAWFDNYDYLVGNKVIARNEQTAFLDRNLRARGGTGSYDNLSVKRVLRNLVFGGKGIVYRPANTNSVIKSITSAPVQAQASEVYNEKAIASNIIGEIHPDGKVIQKELVKMGDENKNLQPVVLGGLTVEDYKGAVAKAAQLEQSSTAMASEIVSLKAKVEAAEKKASEDVAAAKAKAEEVTKKLAEAEAKLAQAAKDTQVAQRRSVLATELKAEGDRLEKLLASAKEMSDESFASFVSSTKELLAATTAALEDFKKKKEEEDDKKKKAESDEAAKVAAAKAEEDKKTAEAKVAAEAAAKAKASSEDVGITDPKILEKIKASVSPSAGVDSNNKGVDLKLAFGSLATAVVNANKRD